MESSFDYSYKTNNANIYDMGSIDDDQTLFLNYLREIVCIAYGVIKSHLLFFVI